MLENSHALIHDNLESAIKETAPVMDKEHTDAEKKEYDTWKLCDKNAKSLMLIYMDDNLIKMVEVCTTAKEIKGCKEKYDTTFMVNVQLLLHTYNAYKMKENENVIG